VALGAPGVDRHKVWASGSNQNHEWCLRIIMGGNPAEPWQIRAFVFPKGQDYVEFFGVPPQQA